MSMAKHVQEAVAEAQKPLLKELRKLSAQVALCEEGLEAIVDSADVSPEAYMTQPEFHACVEVAKQLLDNIGKEC